MKKRQTHHLIIILLLTSASFQSFSQWNIEVNNSNNNLLDLPLILPFSYSSANCVFDVSVFDFGIQSMTIDNAAQCNLDHYLVIDGYKYLFNNDFSVSFDSTYIDFTGGINLGSCSTVSGNPINFASPFLFVEASVFQLDQSFIHHIQKVGNEMHFVVQTSNTDVICAGAMLADQIFKGGFEL